MRLALLLLLEIPSSARELECVLHKAGRLPTLEAGKDWAQSGGFAIELLQLSLASKYFLYTGKKKLIKLELSHSKKKKVPLKMVQ